LGATVDITISGEVNLRWTIVSDGVSWAFQAAPGDSLAAELRLTSDQVWRLLSNNFEPGLHGEIGASGDPKIVHALLRTRAIIGTAK
jgi:hypothetical protein